MPEEVVKLSSRYLSSPRWISFVEDTSAHEDISHRVYLTPSGRRVESLVNVLLWEAPERALVEGAWAYRYPAKVSESIQKRLENLPKPIQNIAWKAQVRLCKRYRRLITRGKHPNVAVTAVARELLGFMWAIARRIQLPAMEGARVAS